MVTPKDWKKIRDTTDNIQWEGKDGDLVEVTYIPDYQGGNLHWLVGASGLLHIKKFSTKSQAVKSANKYMKEHPEG